MIETRIGEIFSWECKIFIIIKFLYRAVRSRVFIFTGDFLRNYSSDSDSDEGKFLLNLVNLESKEIRVDWDIECPVWVSDMWKGDAVILTKWKHLYHGEWFENLMIYNPICAMCRGEPL